jgi:hypothetical protein
MCVLWGLFLPIQVDLCRRKRKILSLSSITRCWYRLIMGEVYVNLIKGLTLCFITLYIVNLIRFHYNIRVSCVCTLALHYHFFSFIIIFN